MRSGFMFGLAKAIMSPIYAVLFPHRAIGIENLPAQGGFVLCVNHIHARDPFFLSTVIPTGRKLFFMAKKELFKNRLLGAIMTKLGMFPVDRGGSDMAAMRTCLSILREGGVLGIFPQGHRYKHDEKHEMQSGAAFIALRTHAPVVPIHVSGPVRPFRRTTIHIMPPVDLSDLTRPDAPSIGEATRRLGEAIWTSKS